MSLHRSLVTGGKMAKRRSVYTRAERMKILMEEGKLVEGGNVLGLPKVRTSAVKSKAKKKEKAEEGAPAAGAAAKPAAAAAKPAAKSAGKK